MDSVESRIARAFADESIIERALREAARRAILEHRHAGRSIVIRRDGQLVEIEREEIDRELALIDAEAARDLPPAI